MAQPPFIWDEKHKNQSGVVTEHFTDEPQDAAMMAAASDLMRAVHAKDVKAVAMALRAAFQIADAEPHEEGSHMDEE